MFFVNFKSKSTCSQSLYTDLQSVAGGKNFYKVYASYLLASCSNARANVITIDYSCVPGNVFIQ